MQHFEGLPEGNEPYDFARAERELARFRRRRNHRRAENASMVGLGCLVALWYVLWFAIVIGGAILVWRAVL